MAGRYYAATPIGEGMQNIATAISGIPGRQAQAALLAQRRDLVQSQILTDAAHRGVYEEDAAGRRQTRMGREGMAAAIAGSGTSGDGGPDADPQPSPEPVGTPSITTAFMADRMPGDPISVAPAAVVAPTAPVVPGAPNVAAAVVPQGPRTGWTPDMNRRFYSQAILANEDKAADYARGFMGGNMAATETNPDRALSYGQAGAGQSWKTTPTGEAAELSETARKNTLQSADRRYGSDQSAAASRYGADVRAGATVDAAGVRANAPGKGGAKGKVRELTPAQQSKLVDEVRVEGHKKLGRPLTEEEARQAVGAIGDEFTAGSGYTDAKAIVLDNLVTGDKGESSPWYKPWGDSKPDTRKLNLPERRAGGAAPAAGGPAGAAPAPAGGKGNGPTNEGERAMAAEIARLPPLDVPKEIASVERDLAGGNLNAQDRATAQQYLTGLKARQGMTPAAAAAPAPAAAKPSTSLDEWKSKAKAKGWNDKQIADALKAKGF